MPTQTDFDKVNRAILVPMKRHWPAEFDADMVDDFVKALARFSEPELKSAMGEIILTQKTRPKLAHIMEEINRNKPKVLRADLVKTQKFHCLGFAEVDHPRIAAEILATPEGQLALEFGVARDMLLAYEVSGKRDFTPEDVRKFKHGLQQATLALAEGQSNPAIGQWKSIFSEMQNREKALYASHYRRAA